MICTYQHLASRHHSWILTQLAGSSVHHGIMLMSSPQTGGLESKQSGLARTTYSNHGKRRGKEHAEGERGEDEQGRRI